VAEESDSGERTEEPTARRLQKAREDGQVARSVDLAAAGVTLAAVGMLFFSGSGLAHRLADGFAQAFVFDRKVLESPNLLPGIFMSRIADGLLLVTPIFIATIVVALIASMALGGLNFSSKAIEVKFSKLSLMSGLQRMFGTKAAFELGKAIAKCAVVGLLLVWVLYENISTLSALGALSIEPALAQTGALIAKSALIITFGLVLIALVDVPYQYFDFMKRMRMSHQEIREEMKDMEGRPEVRAEIRKRQREIATRKMMTRVKDADVVITNPDHFSVALAYDPSSDGAPVLVAKGVDHLAFRIRDEARKHGVQIFEAPPLARSLYYTTDLEENVPEPLYVPVAQVIAYVFSLASVKPGVAPMNKPVPAVPPEMRYDADGKKEVE
jgi:flagellar biosynthetic protein FlhB